MVQLNEQMGKKKVVLRLYTIYLGREPCIYIPQPSICEGENMNPLAQEAQILATFVGNMGSSHY